MGSVPRRAAAAASGALRLIAGERAPLKVTCHLTWRCGLACRYCGRQALGAGGADGTAPGAGGGVGREMSTRAVLALMRAFARAGCVAWTFNGGEPLLREDLPELVAQAASLGLSPSLVTNATLLADQPDLAWTRSLSTLLVSLDGPREATDAARGEGTFDRAMAGLEAVPSGGPKIVVVAVLTRESARFVPRLLELAGGLGAGLIVQPFEPRLAGPGGARLAPSPEELGAAVDALLRAKAEGAHVVSSRPYLRLLRDSWPRTPHAVPCLAGRAFCNVTPDGGVAPCCARLAEAVRPAGPPGTASVEAFRSLPDLRSCGGCYLAGPLEASLLMGMRADALVDLGGTALGILGG